MRGCDWLASCYDMGLLLSGRARGPEGVTVKLINSLVATGSFLFPVEKSAPDSRSSFLWIWNVWEKCACRNKNGYRKWLVTWFLWTKKSRTFPFPFCMKMTKTWPLCAHEITNFAKLLYFCCNIKMFLNFLCPKERSQGKHCQLNSCPLQTLKDTCLYFGQYQARFYRIVSTWRRRYVCVASSLHALGLNRKVLNGTKLLIWISRSSHVAFRLDVAFVTRRRTDAQECLTEILSLWVISRYEINILEVSWRMS